MADVVPKFRFPSIVPIAKDLRSPQSFASFSTLSSRKTLWPGSAEPAEENDHTLMLVHTRVAKFASLRCRVCRDSELTAPQAAGRGSNVLAIDSAWSSTGSARP